MLRSSGSVRAPGFSGSGCHPGTGVRRDGRVKVIERLLQVLFLDAEHFGKLAGHKAHGLFLQAAFAEGQILPASYDQKLVEDSGDNLQIRTLHLVDVVPEPPVPVLADEDRLVRAVLQSLEYP